MVDRGALTHSEGQKQELLTATQTLEGTGKKRGNTRGRAVVQCLSRYQEGTAGRQGVPCHAAKLETQ